MGNRPVVIRTLDLGADKVPHLPAPEDERNPCLGLRSIRLTLRHLPMFRTQLRAALRASAHGDTRDHVPLDFHADGAAAGENGRRRRDGRPRRAGHRVQPQHPPSA